MRTPPRRRVVHQAAARGKTKIRARNLSNAKPRPTFGAACPHHRAAAARFHPDSKSRRAFAPGGRRLVSSFHVLCLRLYEKPAITTSNEYPCHFELLPGRPLTTSPHRCG